MSRKPSTPTTHHHIWSCPQGPGHIVEWLRNQYETENPSPIIKAVGGWKELAGAMCAGGWRTQSEMVKDWDIQWYRVETPDGGGAPLFVVVGSGFENVFAPPGVDVDDLVRWADAWEAAYDYTPAPRSSRSRSPNPSLAPISFGDLKHVPDDVVDGLLKSLSSKPPTISNAQGWKIIAKYAPKAPRRAPTKARAERHRPALVGEKLLPPKLYHVTLTKHLPAIAREGLVRRQTSNWKMGSETGKRYGKGDVYAFESKLDAFNWALKWDWDLTREYRSPEEASFVVGSGKVAILEIKNVFDDWQLDENDPVSQSGANGRWLKRPGDIGPEYILSAQVFDKDTALKAVTAMRRGHMTPGQ